MTKVWASGGTTRAQLCKGCAAPAMLWLAQLCQARTPATEQAQNVLATNREEQGTEAHVDHVPRAGRAGIVVLGAPVLNHGRRQQAALHRYRLAVDREAKRVGDALEARRRLAHPLVDVLLLRGGVLHAEWLEWRGL